MGTFDPTNLRKTILRMAFAGSTVHIACAFSLVEIFSVLYSKVLRFPSNDPSGENRDFMVLSKGHGVMAQYSCMFEKEWLSDAQIDQYFSDGSSLSGLADSRVPGIEATTGSLGHGFSVAVGLALGAKLKSSDQRTFVIVGDGEINEGPIWEAAMFASHHKLRNLFLIVDENGFQAMGRTDEIINLTSVEEKFESFGFETVSVDGHDTSALTKSFNDLISSSSDKPKAIIAKTVKGKGVSFMENDNVWHYTRLNQESHQLAMAELEAMER